MRLLHWIDKVDEIEYSFEDQIEDESDNLLPSKVGKKLNIEEPSSKQEVLVQQQVLVLVETLAKKALLDRTI